MPLAVVDTHLITTTLWNVVVTRVASLTAVSPSSSRVRVTPRRSGLWCPPHPPPPPPPHPPLPPPAFRLNGLLQE
eukprot:7053671-Pyramimonas_sp.AAC.1